MLSETEQDLVEKAAEQAAIHTEPFCDTCKQQEVDPLGSITGINTSANKAVNRITDEIMEREELDPMCQSEVRMEVIEEFYKHFNQNIEDKRVDSHVKCLYCFENKKQSEDHIPILVSEDPNEWFNQNRKWL